MPIRCVISSAMNRQVNSVVRLFALMLLAASSSSSVAFVDAFRSATTTTTPFKTHRQGTTSCCKTTTTALGVSAGWWNRNNPFPMPWDKPMDNKWEDLQRTATSSMFPVIKDNQCDIHLVDLPWLKPHEEVVSEKHVEDLLQATLGWGAYVSPLLVDRTTGAILDGHHRYHVGKRLGLTRVPAVLVDYMGDHEITVDVWDGCGLKSLTKHQVLAMAISDKVFPPKTSKHTFVDSLPPIKVPLKTLKGKE